MDVGSLTPAKCPPLAPSHAPCSWAASLSGLPAHPPAAPPAPPLILPWTRASPALHHLTPRTGPASSQTPDTCTQPQRDTTRASPGHPDCTHRRGAETLPRPQPLPPPSPLAWGPLAALQPVPPPAFALLSPQSLRPWAKAPPKQALGREIKHCTCAHSRARVAISSPGLPRLRASGHSLFDKVVELLPHGPLRLVKQDLGAQGEWGVTGLSPRARGQAPVPQVRTRESPPALPGSQLVIHTEPPHRVQGTGCGPRPGSTPRSDSCDHLPNSPPGCQEAGAKPSQMGLLLRPRPTLARTGQAHAGCLVTPSTSRPWEATLRMTSPAVERVESEPELPRDLAWGGLPVALATPSIRPPTWQECWALSGSRQTDRQTDRAGGAVLRCLFLNFLCSGWGPLFSLGPWFPGLHPTSHMALGPAPCDLDPSWVAVRSRVAQGLGGPPGRCFRCFQRPWPGWKVWMGPKASPTLTPLPSVPGCAAGSLALPTVWPSFGTQQSPS